MVPRRRNADLMDAWLLSLGYVAMQKVSSELLFESPRSYVTKETTKLSIPLDSKPTKTKTGRSMDHPAKELSLVLGATYLPP